MLINHKIIATPHMLRPRESDSGSLFHSVWNTLNTEEQSIAQHLLQQTAHQLKLLSSSETEPSVESIIDSLNDLSSEIPTINDALTTIKNVCIVISHEITSNILLPLQAIGLISNLFDPPKTYTWSITVDDTEPSSTLSTVESAPIEVTATFQNFYTDSRTGEEKIWVHNINKAYGSPILSSETCGYLWAKEQGFDYPKLRAVNPALLGALTLPTGNALEVITNSRLVNFLFCNDDAFVDLKISDDIETQKTILKQLNNRVSQYLKIIDYFTQTDATPLDQRISESQIEKLKTENTIAIDVENDCTSITSPIQKFSLNKMLFTILTNTLHIVKNQIHNEQHNPEITSNPISKFTHPRDPHQRLHHFLTALKRYFNSNYSELQREIAFKQDPKLRKAEKHAYIRHRYIESSLEVVFEFAYLARGAYIPEKVRSFSEFIDIVQDIAAVQVAGANDFASLSKEWTTGQTENLYILEKISRLENPLENSSFNVVIPTVTNSFFKDLPTNFEHLALRLFEHVNANGEAMYSPAVESAIDALRHWQANHLLWEEISQRHPKKTNTSQGTS